MTPFAPLVSVCALFLFTTLPSIVHAHGLMAVPNTRGLLKRTGLTQNAPIINDDSEVDFKPHFPAGDKNEVPGSGKRSQERAAGPAGWVPYDPYSANFRWRSGICGDEIGKPQDHMKGGKYFNGGQVSATYVQGQTIELKLNIVAHHNGFMELHVCDVGKCGGDISRACFLEGHCQPLERKKNTKCESGNNMRCGPWDRNNPGRWYFPCSDHYFKSNEVDFYGGDGTILYDLPDNLRCEHCVLQWYWVTGNSCNPDGVIEYFDSPWAPNWGNCQGQGGAVGGVARVQAPCGRDKFPEEYYTCADIKILPRGGGGGGGDDDEGDDDDGKGGVDDRSGSSVAAPSVTPTPTGTPSPTPTRTPVAVPAEEHGGSEEYVAATPSPSPVGRRPMDYPPRRNARDGVIEDVVLIADGRFVQSVNDMDEVDITDFDQIAIECLTRTPVDEVKFFLNARLVWTDFFRPYFMFGNRNRVPNYWTNPPVNRLFWLKTVAVEGSQNTRDVIRLKFVKRE
eukprot:GFKZ01002040.1.p1 GENE.GFKZ01002040.1~~GFKZ01002040.1.p1  ORF type:complete len:508 (-),score=53.21 GFKZ01002040.1:255-1778(-)